MKLGNGFLKKFSVVATSAIVLSICLYAYTFIPAPDKIGVSNQTQGNATVKDTALSTSPSEKSLSDISQSLEETPFATETSKPQPDNDEVLGTKQTSSFTDGTYLVAIDIVPGTYETTDPAPLCSYEKLSGMTTSTGKLTTRTNGKPETSAKITIEPTDTAFMTTKCGTWNKIN